ncbi:type VII secretion system-associated protein [Streptomyces asoensis]|uniref:type VII secretion system-associated protein n=1 Tax=Streptomyces asoensis TaxID=249586 RepID=UPI0033DF5E96
MSNETVIDEPEDAGTAALGGVAEDTGPPVPDEIKEAARQAPDHWLGMVDPAWSGEGEPPNWAVIGQWRSGLDGEIEEWRPNEEYRPSPQALGWPAPTDPVDEAVQLAATGYGPGDAVPRALARVEVAVLLAPGGGPLSATSPDGQPVVPVFTSPTYLHVSGRFGYELMSIPLLADRMPADHVLYLNPSGPVGMTVNTEALHMAVLAATSEQAASAGEAFQDDDVDVAAEDLLPTVPRRPTTTGSDVPVEPTHQVRAGADSETEKPGSTGLNAAE